MQGSPAVGDIPPGGLLQAETLFRWSESNRNCVFEQVSLAGPF